MHRRVLIGVLLLVFKSAFSVMGMPTKSGAASWPVYKALEPTTLLLLGIGLVSASAAVRRWLQRKQKLAEINEVPDQHPHRGPDV